MLLPLLVALAHAQAAPTPPAAPAEAAPAAAPATPIKVVRLAKMAVEGCGCSLYAPPGLTFGAPSASEDGASVWTGDVQIEGWTFGAVVVKFKDPMVATPDELEALLVSYAAFLQGQFGIVASAGVGRGHTHRENPAARGVIDYWKDNVGDSWAVKGWVDPERLALLSVAGKGDYPILNVQQMYLDGFRFK